MIEIETERLILRRMRAGDAVPLMDVFGDPRVMAHFHRGPFSMAEMDAWVGRNLEHQRRHGFGLFTMVERGSNEVIGDCGLEHVELDGADELELGYDLRPDRWGQGLASEAAGSVARYAFDHLGVRKVVSLIRVDNERSRRVALRIGMVGTGRIRRGEITYEIFALEGSQRSAG
jgi:[ribosomal protein S5]-alanine N-acetyltransferase